ncbi:MAG TPA: NmrA family transcriptional regulator, partial [Phycisphaerales bacterium]|nr:NmrA family transcriptional regulator [Phycisphaerales bacterium]
MTTSTLTDPRPILVTASTGKTGRRVANLLEADNHPVRRASRSAPVPFEWTDHTTYAPNLKGVRAAYIAYTPDLSVPRAQGDIRAFVNAAIDEGVERLVLLSGRGEPAAEACEDIVRESGLEYTLVRAAWFNQNFDEGDFLPMIH